MKSFVRVAWVVTAILAGLSEPTLASDGNSWSVAVGAGAVDQDAIGGAPTVSLELEGRLTRAFALGFRGGYFTKEDCCGEERDTVYAVFFGRARWPRDGAQPFLEAGGGRYEFEGHALDGRFVGAGVDFQFSARRGLLLALRYHSVPRPPLGALPDFGEVQAALHFDF